MAQTALQNPHRPTTASLESLVGGMFEVPPALLAERALLRRSDSKFVVSARLLPELITSVAQDYGILRAGGRAVASYQTLYFDTPDLRCFHDHRRGVRPRHKVRIRHYLDRGLSYLEVKTKSCSTDKKRTAWRYGENVLGGDGPSFVAGACNLASECLEPSVWTDFSRITLVGLLTHERVTIDLGLSLTWGDMTRRLEELAIVEVKQQPYDARTPIMSALRARGLRPNSASKYCIGIAWSRPDIRRNRLLPALRAMERTSK